MGVSKKSILSLFLALVLISTLAITVYAAELSTSQPQPRYSYIINYGGTFDVHVFSCDCNASMDCISSVTKVKIKMQLQKENDGVWSTVETWEKSANSSGTALEGSASISPLSNYRLKCTYTAYTANDSETLTYYAYE